MKQQNFLITTAIVLVTLIMSCAKDDFKESQGLCLTVIQTNPSNNATINVPQ